MTTSRNIEQEVNRIRLEIYEETKNMTPRSAGSVWSESRWTRKGSLGLKGLHTRETKVDSQTAWQ